MPDTAIKKVSKSALSHAMWNWFMSVSVSSNYENMMGTAYAFSMVPITKELYANNPEGRKEAMTRAVTFYNTEPEVGAVIHGVSIAMEEQVAAGTMEGDSVISFKAAMMGPLAGIGDSLIQGIIVPIILALCIDLTNNGLVIGPIIYALAMYAIMIGVMTFTYRFGYNKGSESLMQLVSNGTINKIMNAAGIMGCAVMGALIAKYVNVAWVLKFNIGQSAFDIQTSFFDTIMPKIIPLMLTMGCVHFLRKGKKSLTIILALIVLGIVFGALGILGAPAQW